MTVFKLGKIHLVVRFEVRVLQQMTFHVLVQVAFLSECQLAVLLNSIWAGVWSLICVNTQMIIEVVPLSKVHWAVRVVTLQDLKISLCLRVLKLEYPKSLCRRNVRVRLLLIDL